MVESQNRMNDLNECIRSHIKDATWLNSCELRESSDFGCGVFATRDIEANEVIFGDRPLLLGPTGNKNEPVVCVVCFDKIEHSLCESCLCPAQCGLILCTKSECSEKHNSECEFLRKWKPKNPNKLSFTKAKSMLVIRTLFLGQNDRRFFSLMQKNYTNVKNDIYFDDEFEQFPDDEETVSILRDASAAINTNTFKILYRCDGSDDISVRGFYPMMSLINHHCSPNARHAINSEFESRVVASRPIKKNEQIFVSYSQLLWGTNSRRMHMMVSKKFLCTCSRCIDPTENATNLSAIRCRGKDCSGAVLSIDPINFKSDARCNICQQLWENKRFLQTQEMAATITRHFLDRKFTLPELTYFIEARLLKLVPECNQFVAEAKLKAVRTCTATSSDDLRTIKQFCEDILSMINQLGMGECSLKGYLAYKLYVVRKALRDFTFENIDKQCLGFDAFLNNDEQLWQCAKDILMNTTTAPCDFANNESPAM